MAVAIGRQFRRQGLQSIAKYSAFWPPPPQWVSEFFGEACGFSRAVEQGQPASGYRLRLVTVARRNLHVSIVPTTASPGPSTPCEAAERERPWISTSSSWKIFGAWKGLLGELSEQRSVCQFFVRREEASADLWVQRSEILSHWTSRGSIRTRSLVGGQLVGQQLAQARHYRVSSRTEVGRWMRICGAYAGPIPASVCLQRHPLLEGSVRYKSKKKQKKARLKKKQTLAKIKRMRMTSKKRKEDMNPEEKLEFRIYKGRRKMELLEQAIAKFPVQEIPPQDPDVEVLTPEQKHYLKKIGYKNKNYVPVGRRGIYGGTIQNIHLHWKKHETVQVEIAGFSKEEIKVMADHLARLSGGVVIDIHRANIVILYRGRNYKQPKQLIPMKTLDKRKALAKSILEQSLKALQENDKKVVRELAELRKFNERLSGEIVDATPRRKFGLSKSRLPEEVSAREGPDISAEGSFLEAPEEESDDANSDEIDDDADSVDSEFESDNLSEITGFSESDTDYISDAEASIPDTLSESYSESDSNSESDNLSGITSFSESDTDHISDAEASIPDSLSESYSESDSDSEPDSDSESEISILDSGKVVEK